MTGSARTGKGWMAMISREKVIKGLESLHKRLLDLAMQDSIVMLDVSMVTNAIDMLKEQEPKTGKWILDDEDTNSWECSECGDLLQINDGTPHENGWYFCPHCGAKLKEQAVK